MPVRPLSAVWIAATVSALTLAACVENETSDRPGGPDVVVTSRVPQPGAVVESTSARIELGLSGYLDAHASRIDGVLILTNGDRPVLGVTAYDPVRQTLVFTPGSPLTPGFAYDVAVNPSGLRTLTGRLTLPEDAWRFEMATDARPNSLESPTRPSWSVDVAPLLSARCSPCHVDGEAPPLTYDRLRAERAVYDPDRRYVDRQRPDRSYLIEKVLPGYTDRFGTVMPPPWHDGPALDDAELDVLWRWIEGGAPP